MAYSWADRCTLFGELNANDRVLLAGVGRVRRRPVRVEAQFGNDHLALVGRDLLLQELLDLGDPFFGGVQAQVGRRPQVHGDLPGVHLREELAADAANNA